MPGPIMEFIRSLGGQKKKISPAYDSEGSFVENNSFLPEFFVHVSCCPSPSSSSSSSKDSGATPTTIHRAKCTTRAYDLTTSTTTTKPQTKKKRHHPVNASFDPKVTYVFNDVQKGSVLNLRVTFRDGDSSPLSSSNGEDGHVDIGNGQVVDFHSTRSSSSSASSPSTGDCEKKIFKVVDLYDANGFTSGVLYIYVTVSAGGDEIKVSVKEVRQLKFAQIKAEEAVSGDGGDRRLIMASAVLLLLYVVAGTAFYALVPGALFDTEYEDGGAGFVNGLYFTIVTLTTVGYGDMSPTTPLCRLFTCFFVLIGIGFIGVAIGIAASQILDYQENAVKKLTALSETIVDKTAATINNAYGEATAVEVRATEDSDNRSSTQKQQQVSFVNTPEGTAVVNCTMLVTTILVGSLFFCVESGVSFVDGIYFATISGTTVGYGDFSPSSDSGKLVGSLYLFFAVLVVAKALSSLADLPLARRRRRQEALILSRFGKHLEPEELAELVKAFGGNDNRCQRSDFIIGMLIKIGTIKQSDVDRVSSYFDDLDADGNGCLGVSDIVVSRDKIMRQIRGLEANEQKAVLWHRVEEAEAMTRAEDGIIDVEIKSLRKQQRENQKKSTRLRALLRSERLLNKLRDCASAGRSETNLFEEVDEEIFGYATKTQDEKGGEHGGGDSGATKTHAK
eukprot:g3917.t1